MKSKLENFDIFICDKCCEIVMITDVFTLNQAISHNTKCICNKDIISKYNYELRECRTSIDFELVHRKYIKLL